MGKSKTKKQLNKNDLAKKCCFTYILIYFFVCLTTYGGFALLVIFHSVKKNIKQFDQICWTSHVLRMELDTEKQNNTKR